LKLSVSETGPIQSRAVLVKTANLAINEAVHSIFGANTDEPKGFEPTEEPGLFRTDLSVKLPYLCS